MKKIIAYSFNLLFLVTFLASCLGDLDTMPLDNNQLVSDQVYKTKDGYTGVLAKCYSSLILTGQQGGDGWQATWKVPMKDIPVMCVCCSTCRR